MKRSHNTALKERAAAILWRNQSRNVFDLISLRVAQHDGHLSESLRLFGKLIALRLLQLEKAVILRLCCELPSRIAADGAATKNLA
jgi:hypothetical protein